MTDFDSNDPNPYKRIDWALRNYWWSIIPLVGLMYMAEVVADSWGYNGKTIVLVGLLILIVSVLGYDRRANRKRAEAAGE